MAHILYYNRENRWLFILQVISYNRIMSLSTGRAGMLVSIMIFYNLENHSLFMAEEAGYTKPKGKKGDNPVFQPERVFFEKRALSYPLGEELYSYFQGQAIIGRARENGLYCRKTESLQTKNGVYRGGCSNSKTRASASTGGCS
jgi:hypothetical protein